MESSLSSWHVKKISEKQEILKSNRNWELIFHGKHVNVGKIGDRTGEYSEQGWREFDILMGHAMLEFFFVLIPAFTNLLVPKIKI